MLCHLSSLFGLGIIFPLVIYFAMRGESRYVAANAGAALNFHLSILIYVLVCIPLCLIYIGMPILIIIALGSFILSIIAAVKVAGGQSYQYPLTIRLFRQS